MKCSSASTTRVNREDDSAVVALVVQEVAGSGVVALVAEVLAGGVLTSTARMDRYITASAIRR